MRRKSKFIKTYWIVAAVFAIIFGEIITGLISGNPAFFNNWIAISVYYFILTLPFGYLISRTKPKYYLSIFFIYGVAVEYLLFKNIATLTDLKAVVFFGLLYVFLFGTPVWILKKRGIAPHR